MSAHHFLNEALIFRRQLVPLTRLLDILFRGNFGVEHIDAHRTFNTKVSDKRFGFVRRVA